MLMLGGPEKGAGKSSRPPTLNAKKTDGDAPTPRGGSSGARDPEVGSSGGGPSARPSWERGAGFCTLLLFVLWFLHRFGAATLRHFEPEALRDTFEAAGEVGGVALYVAAFAVGELLHVPAALFVAAGVLVWGRTLGWLLAVFAAPVALTSPFLLVRRLGGAAFQDMRLPLFKRILERLDSRPLSTVLLLRVCFFMSPAATYALALSSVSFRTYILGSALGLLPPLTLIVLFAEQAMALLGYSLPETSEAALDAGMAAAAAVMGGEGGWGVALQALSLRAGSVAKMAATNVVAA